MGGKRAEEVKQPPPGFPHPSLDKRHVQPPEPRRRWLTGHDAGAVGPVERTHLVIILSRLESSHGGEKVATAQAATRTLRNHGLAWDELIAPHAMEQQGPRQHQARPAGAERLEVQGRQVSLTLCRPHLKRLNTWEFEFILLLAVQRKSPTASQAAKLTQIAAALHDRGFT